MQVLQCFFDVPDESGPMSSSRTSTCCHDPDSSIGVGDVPDESPMSSSRTSTCVIGVVSVGAVGVDVFSGVRVDVFSAVGVDVFSGVGVEVFNSVGVWLGVANKISK